MTTKITKTGLLAINAELVEANARLLQRLQALEAEALALKSPPVPQVKTEVKASTISSIPDVLTKLEWKGSATAEFLAQFKFSVKNGNWCCIVPWKATKATQEFIKEINGVRFSKNIQGNWYNNTGCWMKF